MKYLDPVTKSRRLTRMFQDLHGYDICEHPDKSVFIRGKCSFSFILCLLCLLWPASALAADPPALTIRQNHLFFQIARENGRTVCGVEEIVVVESVDAQPAGTLLLSVPENAVAVMPAAVPPIMPGSESSPPLREDEIEISSGQILVNRHIHPGKNTFAFRYILPVSAGAFRLEKKVLLQTRLLVSFAPDVEKLTAKEPLMVEKADGGYKIIGTNLPAGSSIELNFEGVDRAVLAEAESRRDGSDMTGGEAVAMPTSTSFAPRYLVPSVAGVLLAFIVSLYIGQVKKTRASSGRFRQFLMDEMEALDGAAEHKEISAEYHKRRKKALMDRLRSEE